MSATLLVTLFVVGLLVSVAVHELGHLAAARASRMAVSDFSVGFGQPLITVRRAGIAYRLRILPLGGFVRIHGMRPDDPLPDDANGRRYVDRPAWQRALVAAAGPGANVIFAWLLLMAIALSVPVAQGTQVAEDGVAGLQAGDRIVSVSGTAVSSFDELASTLRQTGGPAILGVKREGATISVALDDVDSLGAVLAPGTSGLPLRAAPQAATRLMAGIVSGQATGVRDALAPSALAATVREGFAGEARQGDGVMSMVGLGQIVARQSSADEATRGQILLWLVFVIAVVNVLLAILNLIPVTPLDGGHLILALLEGTASRLTRGFGSGEPWFVPRPVVRALTIGAATFVIGLGLTLITLDVVNPVRLGA